MTPVAGIRARATRPTAAMPALFSPASPVAAVASGGVSPRTGPAVVSVPWVPLMRLRLRCRTCRGGARGGPKWPSWPRVGGSGHALVGRHGEEVVVLVSEGHLGEQGAGIV